jgi:hypothetical protein
MKNKFLIGSCLSLTFFLTGVNKIEGHGEKNVTIPEGQPVPSVDLVIHEDSVKGWNLELKVSNFNFAPEKINQESNLKEGHAHLYINDQKITRIYGNWYYLPELEPGTNEIKVTLNTNEHENLIYNNSPIQDLEIIQVK